MSHITQRKLQQLIRQYTRRIRKPKQRMIREARSQAHCPRMQNCLVAQIRQARVSMHNLDPLADKDLAEYGKGGEDGRHGRLAVDHLERYVVDLEAIREVADPVARRVGMRDYYYLVAAVGQFCRELVYVGLDAA